MTKFHIFVRFISLTLYIRCMKVKLIVHTRIHCITINNNGSYYSNKENIIILYRHVYIYNIRTLSVNIKFICTSFRNRQNSELCRPVSQRVQMNFIFNDNVRIMCLSCNVKKVGKLVRFKQKGQKQASFLAFHKCCQGCLLLGLRYISTSFILVCTLCCT
jgi:hypothetical protein